MARLYINLLGSYRVSLDEKPLRKFDSDKARLLLAYLAVEASKPHRRDHLAGLFWPDQPEVNSRQNLNQALYNLRLILGERGSSGTFSQESTPQPGGQFLLSDHMMVQFNPSSNYILDVCSFSDLFASCQSHQHRYQEACPDCMLRLEEMEALYQGEFLEDIPLFDSLPFEDWVTVWREHLHRDAFDVLGNLSQYHENRGELREALLAARRQVELDPLWEAGQHRLIRLHLLMGQYTAALQHYDDYARLLTSELAIPVEAKTQMLLKRINQEKGAEHSIIDLPPDTFPLIGRKQELAEVHCFLNDPDCRLLTILGPGGCGKSRLAVAAARSVRYSFRDGIHLVPLSAMDPSQSFTPVIAEALGFNFRDQPDPAQQLLDYLRHKNMLLVMDGFEAVLPGVVWVSEILRVAPEVKFLVTSRASLDISQEQIFILEGMPVPAGDQLNQVERYDSVQLFLTFARHRLPAFKIDEHSIQGVANICRLLDGLPLGLLLASSWVGLYSPDEIGEQIRHNLAFLKVDWSDIPARQRSLQATFEYSWDLLSAEERRFFSALSVFSGSFSMQAVKHVVGPSARLLRSLVDKCLVNPVASGRHNIHDLVHQFATQHLEQDPAYLVDIHTRHSQYYMDVLMNWGEDLQSSRQRDALEEMDLEVENLRAAWRWAVTAQKWPDIASSLDGMGWYADLRFRFQEGERACRTALEILPKQSESQLFSALKVWQAHFLRRMEQIERAGDILHSEHRRLEALQLMGNDVRHELAQVLYELGELSLHIDREKARNYLLESLDIFTEINDVVNSGKTLFLLGEIVHHSGDYVLAGKYLAQALPILQAAGEPHRLADNLRWLGFNEIRQGRITEGEPYIHQAIEVRRLIGDLSGVAQSQDDFATVLAWRGRYQEAKEMFTQCLPVYEELGMHAKVAWALALLGLVNSFIPLYNEARQMSLRCVQFASQMHFSRELALAYVVLGKADIGERKFTEARLNLVNAIEVERSIPQSDELAFGLGYLVLAELGLDQVEQACLHLREALEIYCKTRGMFSATICFPASAVLLARLGKVEKAIEVQSLMQCFPAVANSAWFEDNCWQIINALASGFPTEVVQLARQRGQNGNLFSTAEELLTALPS